MKIILVLISLSFCLVGHADLTCVGTDSETLWVHQTKESRLALTFSYNEHISITAYPTKIYNTKVGGISLGKYLAENSLAPGRYLSMDITQKTDGINIKIGAYNYHCHISP